jgi:hypothetical protein
VGNVTKLARLLCIGLVVNMLMIGCSPANNDALETTPSPQPTTTEKNTELPEGIADQEKNKPLTTTAPKSEELPPITEEKEEQSESPPVTPPRNREVPPVEPINKNGAIAKTYSSPDISGTIIPYLAVSREQLGICQDEGFDPDLSKKASEVYRVGENTYLTKFLCTMSAYQPVQEYYLYKRTNDAPIVATLPITYFYRDPNGKLIEQSERAIAGLADYDPTTQTISLYTKDRGLGDCGSLGFYQLKGDELVVTRVLAKDECDGNYVEPENYPQVYP